MKLYLIRHAQSQNNAVANAGRNRLDSSAGRNLCSADPALTDIGHIQARRVAEHLIVVPSSRGFRTFLTAAVLSGLTLVASSPVIADQQIPARPNIVYMLADDLGYGDISHLNSDRGRIPTPHIDSLAREGMTFTDAHSGAAVCTPTRYGILTGRYAWRTRMQSGAFSSDDQDSLIAADRLTVGALLQRQDYHTAIIGKWHLGMHINPKPEIAGEGGRDILTSVPVGAKVSQGPVERGFDYYLGFHRAAGMRMLMENDRVIEDIEPIDMLPRLTRRAIEYIGERAADAKAGKPFFLYLPFNSPHGPFVPSKAWQGKSGLGKPYADFVMQTDASVGEVLKALERHGLADNTLVIFTSDNGPPLPSADQSPGVTESRTMAEQGHYSSGPLRGNKGHAWDGGHRVPFVVRWPGQVPANSQSGQLVCLTDFMATIARILGVALPTNAGEDSVNILPAMLGTATGPLRESVVHHSRYGMFAIRRGDWKLVFGDGHGGQPGWDGTGRQLYNMREDIGESNDRHEAEQKIVGELSALMQTTVAQGRSTPGEAQQNDVTVDIHTPHPGSSARRRGTR